MDCWPADGRAPPDKRRGRMAGADTPQPLTLFEAIIPIASLIVLVALSYYLFGDAGALGPNQVALVLATRIAVFIAWRRGHTLDSLREAAIESVGSGIGAVFILLGVRAPRACAAHALAHDRRRRHPVVGVDSLEQLRGVHGRHARGRHVALSAVCRVQHRQPAARDRDHGDRSACPARGTGDGGQGGAARAAGGRWLGTT